MRRPCRGQRPAYRVDGRPRPRGNPLNLLVASEHDEIAVVIDDVARPSDERLIAIRTVHPEATHLRRLPVLVLTRVEDGSAHTTRSVRVATGRPRRCGERGRPAGHKRATVAVTTGP